MTRDSAWVSRNAHTNITWPRQEYTVEHHILCLLQFCKDDIVTMLQITSNSSDLCHLMPSPCLCVLLTSPSSDLIYCFTLLHLFYSIFIHLHQRVIESTSLHQWLKPRACHLHFGAHTFCQVLLTLQLPEKWWKLSGWNLRCLEGTSQCFFAGWHLWCVHHMWLSCFFPTWTNHPSYKWKMWYSQKLMS